MLANQLQCLHTKCVELLCLYIFSKRSSHFQSRISAFGCLVITTFSNEWKLLHAFVYYDECINETTCNYKIKWAQSKYQFRIVYILMNQTSLRFKRKNWRIQYFYSEDLIWNCKCCWSSCWSSFQVLWLECFKSCLLRNSSLLVDLLVHKKFHTIWIGLKIITKCFEKILKKQP